MTTYDANPAATHDPTLGGTPPVAWGDLINADLAYLGGAWTTFTPVWSGSTGAPSIGNGTLSGAYLQVGKTLYLRIWMKAGSTTTFGSGYWEFTLPNSLGVSNASTQIIDANCNDSSATTWYVGVAYIGTVAPTTTKLVVRTHGNANAVSTNVPFVWAAGDELNIQGVLEAA